MFTRHTLVGIYGPARNALLAETVHIRHNHRVEVARRAAEEYYLTLIGPARREEVTPPELTAHVSVIAYLDRIGVGGQLGGVTGLATTRHPAFAGCGRGRKHAVDGPAWSRAIAALEIPGVFRVDDAGNIVFCSGSTSVQVDGNHSPTAWRYNLAREGLRRAAELPAIFPAVPMDATPATLAGWAKVINYLEEYRRQLR